MVCVSRLACVRVPWFAAAAIVRCEPTLAERPLVVVQGTPPATPARLSIPGNESPSSDSS